MLDYQKKYKEEYKDELLQTLKELEKELNIQFTHKNSINIELNLFLNYFFKQNNAIFYIGKPFAFYTFLFINSKIYNWNFKEIIRDLYKIFQFNSVITNEIYKYLINIIPIPKKFFIDPTLGSIFSIVLGNSLIRSERSENFNIVYIPDSYLLFGEFWENLNFIKNFPEKINQKIIICFDFNNKNKNTKLNYTIFDIYDIQERFLNYPLIEFKIFDNRGNQCVI